jgi:hypothetical protein
MTAKIYQLPVGPRGGLHVRGVSTRGKQPRAPGELASRRLYLTRRSTSKKAASARAYELYCEGRTCMREAWCVLAVGHDDACSAYPLEMIKGRTQAQTATPAKPAGEACRGEAPVRAPDESGILPREEETPDRTVLPTDEVADTSTP